MNKQIQIDGELFWNIYEYFFGEDAPDGWQADEIRVGLERKIDKMLDREMFTRYKRALLSSERELWRKKYLERRGVLPDFISDTEQRTEPPEET